MRNGAASGSGSLCSSSSTGTVHALLEDVRLGGRLRGQPAVHRSVVRAAADHVVGEAAPEQDEAGQRHDRKSGVEGTSVSVRVYHGGRRVLKKTQQQNKPD